MKYTLFFCVFIAHLSCQAQRMDTVEVAPSFTTVIEFESNLVGGVDIASKAYDVRAVGKVLLLNVKPGFAVSAPTTSLMAQTDSSVHVWIVRFSTKPKKLHYKSSVVRERHLLTPQASLTQSTVPDRNIERQPVVPEGGLGQELVEQQRPKTKPRPDYNTVNTFPPAYGKKVDDITKSKQVYWDVAMKLNNLKFMLYNIHVDEKLMYFAFFIENNSSVSFGIDYLSVAHSPYTKGAKRVQASNPTELETIYQLSFKEILPDDRKLLVYAVPLQAFDDRDNILFKLSESTGNRTLSAQISCKEITTAKRLK